MWGVFPLEGENSCCNVEGCRTKKWRTKWFAESSAGRIWKSTDWYWTALSTQQEITNSCWRTWNTEKILCWSSSEVRCIRSLRKYFIFRVMKPFTGLSTLEGQYYILFQVSKWKIHFIYFFLYMLVDEVKFLIREVNMLNALRTKVVDIECPVQETWYKREHCSLRNRINNA